MNIALCGGHITPALACIDYIQSHHPSDQLTLIGRVYSQSDRQQLAHEKELALHRRVQFIAFEGVRWQSTSLFQRLLGFIKIGWSSLKAISLLNKLKPDVLVSFGGYLAVPLSIAAWILRIPIVTHEQTRSAGTANKLIGNLATQIAVSHRSSLPFFPAQKTIVTGNLLRQALFENEPSQPQWIARLPRAPLLYITGGSQGSQVINSVVQQSLAKLLKECWIVHQCGKESGENTYLLDLQSAADRLGNRRHRYFVREWLTESELAWILKNATAAISRAGANTVDELSAAHLPTLYIPLPFTHDEEQMVNAKAIATTGGAHLLEQKDLNPESLISSFRQMLSQTATMKERLSRTQPAHHAPAKFYQVIQQAVSTGHRS